MANLNKVLLIGNLTRDPELRTLPSGMAVCNFGMAINRNFTDREGNRREETTYVDIESFGKQAETISKYMIKGRGIFVEGRLRLDQWETPAGDKRSKLRVVLDNFQFIGGRTDDDNNAGESSWRAKDSQNTPNQQAEDSRPPASTEEGSSSSSIDGGGGNPAKEEIEEDDVPF